MPNHPLPLPVKGRVDEEGASGAGTTSVPNQSIHMPMKGRMDHVCTEPINPYAYEGQDD